MKDDALDALHYGQVPESAKTKSQNWQSVNGGSYRGFAKQT